MRILVALVMAGVASAAPIGETSLGSVVEAVHALPPDSIVRAQALAVLQRRAPESLGGDSAGDAAVLAELTDAVRARAEALAADAEAGVLSGPALEEAARELRAFAPLDQGIERAVSALAERAGEERAGKAMAAAGELESALAAAPGGLTPSLSRVRNEHFRDPWTSPSAPLPSPAALERAAVRREREALVMADAGLTVAPTRGADHAPAPTLFDTKTGAVGLPHLNDYSLDARRPDRLDSAAAFLRWTRADPGCAVALGVVEDEASGTLRAPLPRSLMARVDHLRATGDALAPALRIADVSMSAEVHWRRQLRALSRGEFVIATPRGAHALRDLHRWVYGALSLPRGYVDRLRRRAATLEKAIARGDGGAAARGRALVRGWESDSRAIVAGREGALDAGLREEVLASRKEAAAVMAERRRWPVLRGWTFRQELGLREFFRLHAPEIRATYASESAWLSPNRRRIMRWLGFDFGPELRVPGYKEFDLNYRKAADALGIPESDRILFVLCYEGPGGTLIHTAPGEPAPVGAVPITRPLTTREILDLMAQGLFPLAHNEFLDQTGDVFYIHDAVSHGVSFLDKPAYARVLMEAARVLVRRDGGLMGLGSSVNRNGPLSDRLFYVLEEFMDFRRRQDSERLVETVELPRELAAEGRDLSALRFDEVLGALERLPASEVAARARRLMARMPGLVESIGGNAADDLFTRRDKLDDLKKPVINKMYFSKTWKMVRQALEDPAANPEPLARALARLQVYMLRLDASHPGQLLLDAARPVQDESSSFWRLMRGSGLLDPADPAELKLLRNLGLADDLANEAETSEVEAKFLLPDLTRLRADLLSALTTGAPDPRIVRRGFVAQQYLEVSPRNVREVIELMAEAGIPFGSPVEQHALVEPGNAKEIRLMTKSLRVHEPGNSLDLEARRDFLQVTVKAVGGLSVAQLETPESLTAEQARRLREIFERLHPKIRSIVRKAYFEPIALDGAGRPLLRPDGKPYSVEVDMFLGKDLDGAPEFVNGEIEFHGATRRQAEEIAHAFLEEPHKLPEYLADDLTEVPAAKTREIAARGVPPAIVAKLRPYAASNGEILRAILKEFSSWADPEVLRLVGFGK